MALVASSTGNATLYECEYCAHKTQSIAYLKNHIRFKHDEEGMVHRCDICDQVFAYQSGVEAHKEQLHVKDGIILRCNDCKYITNSKYSLKAHIKNNHTTSFFCRKCCNQIEGEFKRKHDYKVHQQYERMKHQRYLRNHKCSKCNYKTDNETKLENHNRTKHSSKSLNCNLCKYKTPFEGKLELHALVEHSKKSCEECDFVTNMKDKFDYHQKEAHKVL